MSRFEGEYKLTSLMPHEDLPKPSEFNIGTVYLVGEKGNEWEAWFLCPCGCGHVRSLDILPSGWTLTRNQNGTFSITPSILDVGRCLSHFFIIDSRVQWA